MRRRFLDGALDFRSLNHREVANIRRRPDDIGAARSVLAGQCPAGLVEVCGALSVEKFADLGKLLEVVKALAVY